MIFNVNDDDHAMVPLFQSCTRQNATIANIHIHDYVIKCTRDEKGYDYWSSKPLLGGGGMKECQDGNSQCGGNHFHYLRIYNAKSATSFTIEIPKASGRIA